MTIEKKLQPYLNKPIDATSDQELYAALLSLVKDQSASTPTIKTARKLYYFSAEFLIGKLLSNQLINLGLYDELESYLKLHGKSLTKIEAIEDEPSLGNGGLGRLAACFLDSIASLNLQGDGIGLNYHMGLFKQQFQNLKQTEQKNPWISPLTWLQKTNHSFKVSFGGFDVLAKAYDIDVVGYQAGKNKLHLFDIESIDETIINEGISFDKTLIEKNLTLFLYPDDSDKNGHLLRIYQQYFMVSAGAQLIIKEAKEANINLKQLDQHVVIQINDTHPTLVIPEMIRLLRAENLNIDESIAVVKKMVAYTNHTILQEALEKWPYDYLQTVVPHLMPIIDELNAQINSQYPDEDVAIIDQSNRVHMARICMHYGFSINGVAAIHTEILKTSELNAFYKLYPNKFNNKTNGITFRRWLMHCNPELSQLISETIGDAWKKDAMQLTNLLNYTNNDDFKKALIAIKKKKKLELCQVIKEDKGVDLNPEAIFSIQIKRLHEYKRQQMNALAIIHQYLQIKKGILPVRPITVIFGAKAAPAYTMAKNIIHLILCLEQLTNNDPLVKKYLNVVMVENYNVTYAEKLIPAADISEQISLASKEASGTGNMKFMLNGAVTIGTLDGANVEIADLVGSDNIYIFGQDAQTVINHYENQSYCSKDFYNNSSIIKEAVDFIISDNLTSIGDIDLLTAFYNELLNKDWFMTLLDLEAYISSKEALYKDFEDEATWTSKMIVNIAKAGFFSSDRTIAEYNKDIWKLN